MSKTELKFSEILNKSINNTKAKTFKIANKYENIKDAKQEVLKIFNNQRNQDGYIAEYKNSFVIEIDKIKYHQISNNKIHLSKNQRNQELKILYLSNNNTEHKEISIAELINRYNKNAVRFLSHKNTRFGDIYTEIVL